MTRVRLLSVGDIDITFLVSSSDSDSRKTCLIVISTFIRTSTMSSPMYDMPQGEGGWRVGKARVGGGWWCW